MSFLVIILLVLAILLVIFTLQNSTAIDLNIFFWELSDVPLVVVLLVCVLSGYLIATFHLYPKLLRTRKDLRKQKKDTSKPSEENSEMHDLPLSD